MRAWQQFLKYLEKEMGEETVLRWAKPLQVTHFDAGNLYLQAVDSFHVAWFEEHVRPHLAKGFFNANGRPIRVHVSDPSSLKKMKKDPTAETPKLSFDSSTLDPSATFEHFLSFESNELPLKFLHKMQDAEISPVFLYGERGVGKTHLLMALAHKWKAEGKKVLFVHAETFTEHLVKAIKNSAMQEFRQTYRGVDALLIDDVHLFARRIATQEEFFHTFNALFTAKRPLIFSANTSPQHLEEIEPRLTSRFEWGIILSLGKPKQEDLRKVMLSRSQQLQLILERELVDFLLETFSRNPHALHQALQALALRSTEKNFSLSKGKEILADLIHAGKKQELSAQRIIDAVARGHGITPSALLGKSQTRECALPRQLCMYLCRTELKMPLQHIGRLFTRDHSTVMTSIKQVQKKLEDKSFSATVSEIINTLKS